MNRKVRIHAEWFMLVTKPVCPSCGSSKNSRSKNFKPDLLIFAWGEYVIGKWRNIITGCSVCYNQHPVDLVKRLVDHAGPCGCTFVLQARSGHSCKPLNDLLTKVDREFKLS